MKNSLHMKLLLLGTALVTSPNNISALELELKPVADLSQSFQMARVCFIADVECFEGKIPINPETNHCVKDHFTYSATGKCPPYHYQETCLWDEQYIKCDAEKWCRMHEYTYTTANCTTPKILSVKCLNNLEMYKECKLDIPTACKNENPAYVNACQNGWKLDDARLCTYSPTYGICCNKCEGFDYTAANIPQGYIAGERCDGCAGAKYKKEINPCEGYSTCSEYGPAVGADVCWSGSTRKYNRCETCSYTKTAAECAKTCMRVSDSSCVKNGTTYYAGCSYIYCSSGETCNNGTCVCNNTVLESSCTAQCKSASGWNCYRNGISYYPECSSSTYCSSDQYCSNGSCVCDSSFAYDCKGMGGGYGNACDGKYTRCKCYTGYSWSPSEKTCKKDVLNYNITCCDDTGLYCSSPFDRCLEYYPDKGRCSKAIQYCQQRNGTVEFTYCSGSSYVGYAWFNCNNADPA